MNELDELAVKYKADKWGKHNYTPFYYELFSKNKEEVKKVLEIGTAEGASLFMWRDFFPNAQIYGAEIDQKRVDLMAKQKRMTVVQFDQSKKADLEGLIDKIGNDFDFIVDDGSHKMVDQCNTLINLVGLLKRGGIYVIEDVADIRLKTFLKVYDPKMIEFSKRYDDRVILVKK